MLIEELANSKRMLKRYRQALAALSKGKPPKGQDVESANKKARYRSLIADLREQIVFIRKAIDQRRRRGTTLEQYLASEMKDPEYRRLYDEAGIALGRWIVGKHQVVGISAPEGPGRMALEPMMRYVRGRMVLLDRDAAEYFQVELKALNAAVKRHKNRFPPDFILMFSGVEAAELDRRSAAPGSRKRRRVLGFTEVGVNALAMVLKSDRAVARSLEIIREGMSNFARIRSRRPGV